MARLFCFLDADFVFGSFFFSHKSLFTSGLLADRVCRLGIALVAIWYRQFVRKPNGFVVAREEARSTLDFLAAGPGASELPWLVDRNSSRSGLLKAHLKYAKRRALAVHSPAAVFDDPDMDIFCWGILALHADVPFPALYDLGKFQRHRNDLTDAQFASEIEPRLDSLLCEVTALQTRWCGAQFFLPLRCNPALYSALFGYTSELTRVLLLLAQLVYAIKTGLCFERKYGDRMLRCVERVSAELIESDASLADLLFLHNGILEFWLLVNGEQIRQPEALINSLHPGLLSSLDKDARIAGILDKLLTGNPVSLIMSIGLLADAGLVGSDEEELSVAGLAESDEEKPSVDELAEGDEEKLSVDESADGDEEEFSVSIARLLEQQIPEELLIELAKHLHASLMSDFLKPGTTVFGTTVTSSATRLFGQRLSLVARILRISQDELDSDDGEQAYLRFAGGFFEFLLREWLREKSVDAFKQDIFRQADVKRIPEQVTLSIIKVRKTDDVINRKVVLREVSSGKDFADIARKYSEDKLSRSAGGSLGTVKLGDLQDEIEAAVFLAAPEVSLLQVDRAEYSFVIQIQEREYSDTTSFVKRLASLLQDDQEGLQTGCVALIDMLNRVTKIPAFHRQQDDTIKRVLRLTEQMGVYVGLLKYSSEGVTVL